MVASIALCAVCRAARPSLTHTAWDARWSALDSPRPAAARLMSPDFTVPDAVTAPVLALDAEGTVRGANVAFVKASSGALDKLLGL